ncbi:hypothetical protein [Synoicihabitans lomoniglobus]|uniref:Uncharacterized protein n=1 Tax=Synoicihabitans lomoniglobus TaxID=2909285 RepID=A0AAF0CMQ4_9BACT|nr:hypothetical protein [Opitutaceae bacterium LMO-M01]WED63636.1 hypothetical protein PXH66_14965 [Opitutaceae bacterium LMO-M01]
MSRCRRLFVTATIAATTALTSSAVDISGTYDDKGTQVRGSTPITASFHGLLAQEFDPELATLKFAGTARVQLLDHDGTLVVKIYSETNEQLWSSRWSAREGYSHEGELAVVRMKLGEAQDKRWVLVMQPVENGKLLEVKAYRVLPSYIGPRGEPVGTYLFNKLD